MIVLAAAIYRRLLHLYPHQFWRAFAADLESDFEDGCGEAAASGRTVLVRFLARAAGDFVVSLAREWIRTPWIPVLALAGALTWLLFAYTAFKVQQWPRLRVWPAPAASSDPNGDALHLLVLLVVGALIPIAGTILGSLCIQLLHRPTGGRGRHRV